MTAPVSAVRGAALSLDQIEGGAPEWVHLLPAGEARTVDGRGPYRVLDAETLMSLSMNSGKLPLDENHATDLAARNGASSPARGWIVALQHRADGIWGKVEWVEGPNGTPFWHQYRGISPVISHDKAGNVTSILRASLTNTPNIKGLQTLHSRERAMPRPNDPVLLAQDALAYQTRLAAQGEIISFAAAVRACEDSPSTTSFHRPERGNGKNMDPVLLARDAAGHQARLAAQGITVTFAAAVRACGGGLD